MLKFKMFLDGYFEASFNIMLAECNLRRSLQRSLKEPLKSTMKEPFKSAIVIRTLLFTNFHNKLDSLLLSRLMFVGKVRQEFTQEWNTCKLLHSCRLWPLALLANIRLGWKD